MLLPVLSSRAVEGNPKAVLLYFAACKTDGKDISRARAMPSE